MTCNRLPALERALVSYAAHLRRHARPTTLVVADDSPDPANRRACRRLLARVGRRFGMPARYAGLPEKRRFARRLAREGIAPELVELALFNPFGAAVTIGKNRNALMLETAGSAYFAVDDDTVCRVNRPPEPRPGLAVRTEVAEEWWFFESRRQTLASLPESDVDLLGAHERYLGRTVADCIRAAAPDVVVDRADPRLIPPLRSREARVRVTRNGVAGDHAFPSAKGLPLLEGASRERLLASRRTYRSALRSREVLRMSPAAAIASYIDSPTTFLGLDNREVLPPFLPVRGEDSLFGVVLARASPSAFLAHVPLAVLHAPVEARAFRGRAAWAEAGRTYMCDVLTALMPWLDRSVPRSTETGLAAIGRHLVEIGRLDAVTFHRELRRALFDLWSFWANALQRSLRAHRGRPEFWAADCEAQLRDLGRAVERGHSLAAADLLPGRRPEQALPLAQKLVTECGRLLCSWPDMVAAARELRRRGQGLAASVA